MKKALRYIGGSKRVEVPNNNHDFTSDEIATIVDKRWDKVMPKKEPLMLKGWM